ncbi:MAG: ECF-type sigma factor [Aureliella sp.]|jgi:DNA-directed RNA polymerase specialized sigma24 family protein
MSTPGSVSHWILALKEGDSAAAQPLWERYYQRLVALARTRLDTIQRRVADEEDVVQNAFHSFFRALGQGRFPQLEDRDNLWRLLVVITAHKALKQVEHNNRQKRGGGENQLLADDAALLHCVGAEPTPDFAAQVAEEYRRLLDLLGDDSLRQVAVWKMEGYANDEIATMLDCSRRTVVRKLEAIRILWSQEPPT